MAASKTKLVPLGPRVIVRLDKPLESVGGLIVPEQHRTPSNRGTVVAVSAKSELKEGLRVVFHVYAGSPLEGHDDLLIMAEEDLLAAEMPVGARS